MAAKTARLTRTATAVRSWRKPSTGLWPDQRQGEGVAEQLPVGLGDGGQQDHEAPEGEEVGQPGIGRLSSLRWPKTSTSSARRRARRPGTVRGRLAGGDQPDDPLRPLPGQGDGEEGEHGPMASFIARPPGLVAFAGRPQSTAQ
jgi:hypothetical protein